MSKKQYVFFTEVATILSEAGEKKLEKATSKKSSDNNDSGMPLEWYLENNLRPPIGLEAEESEIDDEGFIKLKEGEYTYDFINRFIDMSDFFTAVDSDEFGTILQFYNGREYWVEEDIIEVYARIHYAQRNWSERVYDSIVEFFSRVSLKGFARKKEIKIE